jgi:hypothetical protein
LALLAAAAPARGEPAALLSAEPTTRGPAVAEEDWAAELVRALGLAGALPAHPAPRELFEILCVAKAEPRRAAAGGGPGGEAARVSAEAPQRSSPQAPLRLVLSVPATAVYQLSVEGVGLQRWLVDGEPAGHLDPTPLGVEQAAALLPLRAGPHELTAHLGPGARAERVALSAWRPLCAAPAAGFREGRPLRHAALARTLVGAFGFERRLPELRDEERSIEAERFEEVSGEGGATQRELAGPASGGAWAAALAGPAQFSWSFELDEPRVVSVEARTHGVLPQLWSLDGRSRVRLEPIGVEAGFAWNHVATLPLAAGRHEVRALVARGSGVDLLRIVSHRSGDADYLGVLEGLGLPGHAAEAPVARAEAEAVLASTSFVELAAAFRQRLAGSGADRSVALVEEDAEPWFSRPLSPLLPAEL